MPGCISCARGLCAECHELTEECCLKDIDTSAPVSSARPGRPLKRDEDVVDPRSTMRKRAQKILQEERNVNIGDPCEWRGLADAGGGRHPIVGCRNGVVRHIHHGPDKDYYHNTPDNLHGICHHCHNRWHARNDPCYDDDSSKMKHSPRQATHDEMRYWNDKKAMPKVSHENCQEEMSEE